MSYQDQQYFTSVKHYAQRLNQQKHISISYLQSINKLTSQLNSKDELIDKLIKQNNHLKEKLSVYQQVLSRSRITGNQHSNSINILKNNKIRMSHIINRNDITDSRLQTRNQRDYQNQFKDYQHQFRDYRNQTHQQTHNHQIRNQFQSRNQFESRNHLEVPSKTYLFGNQKQSIIINEVPARLQDRIAELSCRRLPLFQQFIIIKPTDNSSHTSQTSSQLKLLFKLNENKNPLQPQQSTITNKKLNQSICTYLCHNTSPSWQIQQYFTPTIQSPKTTINSDNLIVFLSNSNQTTNCWGQNNSRLSKVYQRVNPSLYYYGIGIRHYLLEYIDGKLHKVPVVYCFITRYPFLTYFKELLNIIVDNVNIKSDDNLKSLRLEMNEIIKKTTDTVFLAPQIAFKLAGFELRWRVPVFVQQKIHSQQSINGLKSLQTNHTQRIQVRPRSSSLPSSATQQQLLNSIILSQLSPIFNSYSTQLLIDVIMLLLLQIPIAIVSTNEQLLNKFMFYFVYVIKPLKYNFPIVFNLPKNMEVLLQSPFPSFIGISQHKIIQPYLFQRAVFDLDQKVAKSWPNIEFYNKSRQSVIRWINKESQLELKIQKINTMVKLLLNSSRYFPEELKQLKTYRKYFKKTQIWNIYNHQKNQLTNQ